MFITEDEIDVLLVLVAQTVIGFLLVLAIPVWIIPYLIYKWMKKCAKPVNN